MTLSEKILLGTAIFEVILASPLLYGFWRYRRDLRDERSEISRLARMREDLDEQIAAKVKRKVQETGF